MSHEHRLLLALSSILKVSYPHLDELHARVEENAARAAAERPHPDKPPLDPTAPQ